MRSCSGHGTHVTGIIAIQPNNPFNITGVAYKSSIRMYRVFGCTGVVADPYVASLSPTILRNLLLGSSFPHYLKHMTMATMLSICKSKALFNKWSILLCPLRSLGGADGWSESVTGGKLRLRSPFIYSHMSIVVASRIVKKGRVVVAAV